MTRHRRTRRIPDDVANVFTITSIIVAVLCAAVLMFALINGTH